jgi:hypothetical protein
LGVTPSGGNREWFREAIEHELERIGVEQWHFVGYRSQFKGRDFESERDAELGADEFGAVLMDAGKLLEVLQALPTAGGDKAITQAVLGS